MTIACIDVGYTDAPSQPAAAIAVCVVINAWSDAVAGSEHTATITSVGGYQSGRFFLRELPCIAAVLAKLPQPPTIIVIDGYVWLDDEDHPGLGKHLYDAVNQTTPIIGVAKTSFKGSLHAARLLRNGSTRPLFITAVGLPIAEATSNIAAMHGNHRIPTMLTRADRLSRCASAHLAYAVYKPCFPRRPFAATLGG